MSDEKLTEEQTATPEEKERMNSREHLWRAALWAGFANQAALVEALRAGMRPWFGELAPLTVEERVYVMAQLIRQWYPEMDKEREQQAMRLLCKMYGVKKPNKSEHRYVH